MIFEKMKSRTTWQVIELHVNISPNGDMLNQVNAARNIPINESQEQTYESAMHCSLHQTSLGGFPECITGAPHLNLSHAQPSSHVNVTNDLRTSIGDDPYYQEDTYHEDGLIGELDDDEHDSDGAPSQSSDDDSEPRHVHPVHAFLFMRSSGKNGMRAFSDISVLRRQQRMKVFWM